MNQPHAHLAFAPRGPGLIHAAMWLADGDHVYGWLIAARNQGASAAYFVLQHYLGTRDTVLLRSLRNDVEADWAQVRFGGEVAPAPPPVPQPMQRKLSRLQDVFLRHWLFFDSDPDSQLEADALRARQLPVRRANIRASRLDKLRCTPTLWRYDSPQADQNVLVRLSEHWPLDFDVRAS